MSLAVGQHQPVLLKQSLDALLTTPSGVYCDGTYGRGGHSRGLLSRLARDAKLWVIDRDPEAIADARDWAESDPRIQVRHGCFSRLQDLGEAAFDGVLLDLGVSSPQLDSPERGFSFMRDGRLDMRMDPQQGESAATWLARASEQDIAKVLRDYGEERHARKLARTLVRHRDRTPIETTRQLAELVRSVVPRKVGQPDPATRTFQAIRICINDELGELHRALQTVLEVLRPGGRLAVISFHSLEDRMVKQFIRLHDEGPPVNRRLPPVQHTQMLRSLGRWRADAGECSENVRARSAVLRAVERCEVLP